MVVRPVPVPQAVVTRRPTTDEPPPATVVRSASPQQTDFGRYIQQLFDQEERVRSDAALELGRLKAQQAVDPLCTLVATDRSPLVRDAAARALGLIGSPRGLTALQNAAQADPDRDVRRSAQFSAEVIRTSLRQN